MIAAVLVLYSPEYCERSISTLRNMLQRIDEEILLIAVCNRTGLPVSPSQDLEVVQGSNFLHEFGGWDLGIAHFRQMAGDRSPDLFVLANDTFCHHRPFSWLEEHIFSTSFRQAARKENAIAGERSDFGQDFSVNGLRMDSWVSTYLYALTPGLLESLNWQTTIDEETLKRLVLGGMDEKKFFSSELDPLLVEHLSGWLFANRERRLWRSAAPLGMNNANRVYDKARAILCEKYLTARSKSMGAEFLDPYQSIAGRIAKACKPYRGTPGIRRSRFE